MVRAMRQHKIPIVLLGEMEQQGSTTTTNTDSMIVKSSTGEEIDLRIPANKTKPNKFILFAIDQLFKNEELLNTDARCIDTDNQILSIRDAVRVKFGLTDDQLPAVWPPMLDCIKSRRRNSKAKIRKSIPKLDDNNPNDTSGNWLMQSLPLVQQNSNIERTDEHF